jgi:cytochrome c556
MKIKPLVLAVAAVSVSFGAAAQMKVEDAIKIRQAGYRFMGWNMGKINGNLKGEFKADEVKAAANVLQAIANSGMGALYPAGSDKGVGFHETAVKPEFFKNMPKVGELAKNFNKEANELAKVAATGDKAAVQAQFGKLGEACKACHDDFRKED